MTIYDSVFDPNYTIEILEEMGSWPKKGNCYKVKLTNKDDPKKSFEISFLPKTQYNLAMKLRPIFQTMKPKEIKEILVLLDDVVQESYSDGSDSAHMEHADAEV